MERRRMNVLSVLAIAGALALPLACSDSDSPSAPNQDKAANQGPSKVVVKLTDAPFSTDQVKSVDIFVVRAEGRVAATDDNDANQNLDSAGSAGWRTLAEPNASFDLLTLQHGTSVTLGETPIPAGTYNGLRLIIDPSQSSVTLKDGTVLTGNSKPGVSFPSASRSGIKIIPSQPVTIEDGETTTLLVDFDVSKSFVQRGNSIEKNGLLFKPVIKATIVTADSIPSDTTSTDTLNATFRFSNALDTTLTVLVDTTAVGSNLAFGASSSCSSVTAATPLLSAVFSGTTTALTGFAPVLSPGGNYTLLAYPDSGGIHFATLANAFTPTTGQSGLRVFNASGDSTGIDVFVTAAGDSLGTATVANALQGVASAFVNVPAGSSQVRVTSTGSSTVLLDLGAQSFTADKNATLVVAPPASDSTPVRAFLVPSC